MSALGSETTPFRISVPRREKTAAGSRLSAELRLDDRSWEVYFQSPDAELCASVEPFVALALSAAMLHRRTLAVESAVSPRLLGRLPELQRVFVEREPSLSVVEVRAPPEPAPPAPANADSALFFSGGVDSFYSLLEFEAQISHLVFVHGFDLHVSQPELYARVLPTMRAAAAAFHKRLVRVETNLREFTEDLGSWPLHFYGPAKAATALALAPLAHRFFSSGENITPEYPDCSRLELDPLWSTEAVEIVHVGHDASRFEKLRRIGPDARVQPHLRVCWENQGGRYNCCECSKCLRNMAALRALGCLDAVTTFDRPLNLRRVARWLYISDTLHRSGIEDIVAHLRERNADPELAHALRQVLARYGRPRPRDLWSECLRFPGRLLRKVERTLRDASRRPTRP